MSSTVILSVVVTANSLPDLRRRRWAYVAHPISARCLLFALRGRHRNRTVRQASTRTSSLLRSFSSLRGEQHRPKVINPLRSYYLTLLLRWPGVLFRPGLS